MDAARAAIPRMPVSRACFSGCSSEPLAVRVRTVRARAHAVVRRRAGCALSRSARAFERVRTARAANGAIRAAAL
jgi:hypothetical protein